MKNKSVILIGKNISEENKKILEEIGGYIRSVENNPVKQYEICQQMEEVEIERKNEQRKFLSTLKGVYFGSVIVSEGHDYMSKVKTIALKK